MAQNLSAIVPTEQPTVKLDRVRSVQFNFLGFSKIEEIYGSFMAAWSALYRLTNSAAAVKFLQSVANMTGDDVKAAATVIEQQGPILHDVAICLWAGIYEEADDRGERLTIRQVEKWLKPYQLNLYLEAITKAVELMAPPAENPPVPAP